MFKKILCISILSFFSIPVLASDDSDLSFGGSAGVKTVVSSDNLGTRYYLKPFASAKMSASFADLTAGYYLWNGYTITDESFSEKKINIHQGGGVITLYPADVVNFSGTYYYFKGDSSYKGHRFAGEVELCFDPFSVSAGYDGKKSSYDYNGKVKSFIHTVTVNPEYDLTETMSVDLSYDLTYSDYTTYGYTVTQHALRLGCTNVFSRNLILIGGVSGSYDSNDLSSAGVDLSVIWKLFDHLKLSASYMGTADIITSSTNTSGMAQKMAFNAGGSGSGGSSSDSNTSISADYSHSFMVEASLYF